MKINLLLSILFLFFTNYSCSKESFNEIFDNFPRALVFSSYLTRANNLRKSYGQKFFDEIWEKGSQKGRKLGKVFFFLQNLPDICIRSSSLNLYSKQDNIGYFISCGVGILSYSFFGSIVGSMAHVFDKSFEISMGILKDNHLGYLKYFREGTKSTLYKVPMTYFMINLLPKTSSSRY